MGEGTAKARRREVELTRQALAEDVERFARKVRAELNWKARLRRDGPQILAIAGAIALVLVAALLLRSRLRSGDGEDELIDGATVDDLARELRALREDLDKRLGSSGGAGILQKVAVAAAGSAATAGGKLAAARLLDRVEAEKRDALVGSVAS